ncbi:MAG: hypothetical protein KF769_15765, partial [Parvibaculum sp.]|nr:hypothetical protein [Parvibaculum sp.]
MTSPAKLHTVAILCYATLALLWLAIPASVTNWSRDYLPGFVQPYATQIAETVEGFARVTRIPL